MNNAYVNYRQVRYKDVTVYKVNLTVTYIFTPGLPAESPNSRSPGAPAEPAEVDLLTVSLTGAPTNLIELFSEEAIEEIVEILLQD